MPSVACIILSMTTMIREAGYRQGTRAVVPEGNGHEIEIRLMGWERGTETVEGSSGDYPVPVIARDFKSAFPVGTRMRANHDGFCDAGGDIQRVMAKTTSVPVQREDGMYAMARVREGDASDFVRQFADVIGLSVSVGVELEMTPLLDDDGEPILDHESKPVMVPKLSERGAKIVKRFLSMEESPYNAVDFVEAPGADGAIVAVAIEAAKGVIEHTTMREAATFSLDLAGKREKQTPEAAPPRANQKENTVTDEEARALAQEAATAAVAAYAEANRPAPSDSGQPTLGQQTEAVIAAGLTEAGRAEVYTRIERGESLESAIAAESAREASINAEVERRVAEATASSQQTREDTFNFGFTTDDKSGKPLGTESDRQSAAVREAEFDAAMEG